MTTAAVILAAGQGTRMRSSLPKVLHQAAGLPLVTYSLKAAEAVGCSPIVVVVGHEAGMVEAAVKKSHPRALTALQKEQRGTADAVKSATDAVKDADRVLILYGDSPLLTTETLKKLIERTDAMKTPLGLVTSMLDDPTGYGRLLRNSAGNPERVVEHKDCGERELAVKEVNAGIYLCDRAFLFDALSRVGTKNVQKEFYLPDIVQMQSEKGPVAVVQAPAEEILGVNNRVDLSVVEGVLFERNRRAVLRSGCTLRDWASTFIESSVTVEADVVIGPGVQLQGKTIVRSGARIDGPSVVVDSTIEAGAVIKSFSHLEGATVGKNAIVGPYARLRPEAVLEEDVHVGNFVEVKKSTLKKGAKANHLTYLGDATVGEKSNVGAGTITCNYDGVGKYRTEIGRDVFVGSDSVLVAPVAIGDGSYVAAGSVITDDVPANALALGRGRQVNKENRAEQLRAEARQKAGK